MPDLLSTLLIRFVIIALCLGIGYFLEELTHRGRRMPTSVLSNLGHTTIYVLASIVMRLAFLDTAFRLAAQLPGAGVIRPSMNSASAVVLTSAGWLLAHDFLYYWFHRLQHESRWLWAEHELHHADEAMNVTTNFRHHWLEIPLHATLVTLPLGYLVQLPIALVVPLTVVLDGFGYLLHLDSGTRFGALSRWVANPEFHRVHHSVALEHRDKNFAALFPVWDRLFGTYHQPSVPRPSTGVHSGVRIGPLRGIVWPFLRWRTMLRATSSRH